MPELSQQQWIFYIATFGLIGLFYFRVLRTPRPRLPPLQAPRLAEPAGGGLKNPPMPVEVMRWEVHMHETARELKAELDTKLVALTVLLRDVREAEQRLNQLLEDARQVHVP